MKQIFFRLTKADETKREVSGIMVSEAPDKASEVFDYASSKPHFKSWSDEIAKATEGKSLGNVREMHQSKAVGKVTTLDFDDDAKKIGVTAKIYDDSTWEKVSAGVLTGFSIGGKYAKKWADGDLTRYTAQPSEVSLVDNPCVPDAHFQLLRANGSTELVKAVGGVQQFWDCRTDGHRHAAKAEAVDCMKKAADGHLVDTSENTDPDESTDAGAGDSAIPDSDEELPEAPMADADDTDGDSDNDEDDPSGKQAEKVAARTDVTPKEGEDKYGDVKFADPKNKKYPIDTEEHIRAAWNYINKESNAGKYSPADVKSIKARIVAAWKDKIDKAGPPSAADKAAGHEFPDSIDAKLDRLTSLVEKLTSGDLLRGTKEVTVEKAKETANQAEPEKVEKIEKVADGDLAKIFTERLDSLETTVTKAVEFLGVLGKHVLGMPAPAKGVARVVKSDDTGDGAGKGTEQVKKAATSLELMKEAFSKPSTIF